MGYEGSFADMARILWVKKRYVGLGEPCVSMRGPCVGVRYPLSALGPIWLNMTM